MPTWRSADAFAAEIAEFQRKLERDISRAAAADMARKAQRIAEQEASRDLGGDPMMSGWRAAELRTKVKEIPTGAVLMPDGKLAAAGWTTATIGRNVGETGAFLGPGATRRGGAVRRRADGTVARTRGRRGRRWNGVTRGKGTADRAITEMARQFPPIAEREIVAELRKHFDVT